MCSCSPVLSRAGRTREGCRRGLRVAFESRPWSRRRTGSAAPSRSARSRCRTFCCRNAGRAAQRCCPRSAVAIPGVAVIELHAVRVLRIAYQPPLRRPPACCSAFARRAEGWCCTFVLRCDAPAVAGIRGASSRDGDAIGDGGGARRRPRLTEVVGSAQVSHESNGLGTVVVGAAEPAEGLNR